MIILPNKIDILNSKHVRMQTQSVVGSDKKANCGTATGGERGQQTPSDKREKGQMKTHKQNKEM